MVNLFEPYTIGSMEIRNRFVRSATTSAFADENGVVVPEIIKLYEGLSKGGVGLIVKGHLYVDPRAKAHSGMAGISNNEHIPRLKELTDGVHRHGGKIVAQINFGGYQARAGTRMGPSDFKTSEWNAKAMSTSEIWESVEAFGEAARRAIEAEFDGIQIHAAHGYLISEFLSKYANRRTDDWGGSLSNRMRLLKEVYLDIRGRLGEEAVIGMKMNCDDFSPNGFVVEESAQVAHAMSLLGMDWIEISGGGIGEQAEFRPRAKSSDPELAEASFAGHSEKIRAACRPKPVSLVNGIRKLNTMQTLVDRGITDMISMSRPLIREPDVVKKLQAGQTEVECIRCDACRDLFEEEMMRCLRE